MVFVAFFAIWASAMDAKRRRLPNRLLGPMALSALICQLLRCLGDPYLAYFPWLSALNEYLFPPTDCLCAAALLGISLTVVEKAHRRLTSTSGLGFGDIKLASVWTLALGPWGIVALAGACAAGGLYNLLRRRTTFPLGPYLTAAALLLAVTIPFTP